MATIKAIEQKAQRYDEALEKLRSLHDDYDTVSTLIDIKEELENIFPELIEKSEDEQSKNWILEYLYDGLRKSDEQFKGQFKAAIAWLEKQGKNNMGISEATKKKLEDNLNKALEKETPESFNEFLDEQKPAAWSEEDENLFRCAIDAVREESKVRTDGCLDEEVGGMVTDWLKSLKDRAQPQSHWKPSDEQMDALEAAIVDSISSIQKHPLESLYNELKKL